MLLINLDKIRCWYRHTCLARIASKLCIFGYGAVWKVTKKSCAYCYAK